ncbi:MAG TPA: O-antigen ligase family protein [Solirubrobacterales bacterium]|nr:O-antigen ligase family protein [Solirubrobacterales bacterium]
MSDFLAGAGVVVAAGASAAAILLPPGRPRSAAMLLAIALFPILILGDQWHTHQIADLRHDTGRIVALLAVGAAVVIALAAAFRRWPVLIPLAIVFALPFRVPLHAGGDTANLLVPLYLVIAGAVAATLLRDWRLSRGSEGDAAAVGGTWEGVSRTPPPAGAPSPVTGPAARAVHWLPRLLATFVVLYALQSLYSEDFSKGLQNVCFFLVPFTVAFALLRDVEWNRRLLTWTLALVAAEAVAFVLIGSVEWITRSLFWNDQVIRSNEFHTYFRVNSVFWDPNVYGRYLALVLVLVTAALLWVRERRAFWALAATILVLWVGLAQTFSQSSYIALLAGLAVLAAIRWNWRWTAAAVAVGLVGAVLVVTFVGGSGKVNFSRLNIDTSGRANLVQGGIDLFAERPLQGYGSGSFQAAYREHRAKNKDVPVSVSHTEPVTVAAEQGALGLIAYGALVVCALWTMTAGIGNAAAGGGADIGLARRAGESISATGPAARAAVLAAFVALLVHTLAYAGFFEDPITWVLLALGASLAAPAVREAP